jgi:hypothetical protein
MPGSSQKMTDEEREDYFACLREELGASPNESLIDAAQRMKRELHAAICQDCKHRVRVLEIVGP